jgi:mannose-6-phosphate isomerase-like protein (cupin superfamily)
LHVYALCACLIGLAATAGLAARVSLATEQRARVVDPTYLHRHIPDLQPKPADISTPSCQYTPIFGAGDDASTPSIMRGVVRFGKIIVFPGGRCTNVNYAAEEQVYVVLNGTGEVRYAGQSVHIKHKDFMYLPAGIDHSPATSSASALELFVMGFRIEPDTPPPPKLLIANLDEIKKQTVSGHPDSVVYQLMMGNTSSRRDRLAAAHLLTSLYYMEFQPGGTNFPHHHDSEEEIYVLIDGHGDMVAGGGMDGIEGRHAAKPGEAYFFRENCTVGFYNSADSPAHILAVRSLYRRSGPSD